MHKYYLFFLAALAAMACQRGNPEPAAGFPDSALDGILVPAARLTLFADLSEFLVSENPGTDSGMAVPLTDLLDRSKVRYHTSAGIGYRQTPFLQEHACYAASLDSPDEAISQATVIRKYLVESTGTDGTERFVATMIADAQYERFHPGFDFIDKPNFSGVALLSALDGRLLEVRGYRGGRIVYGRAVRTDDALKKDGKRSFLAFIGSISGTRDNLPWSFPDVGGVSRLNYWGGICVDWKSGSFSGVTGSSSDSASKNKYAEGYGPGGIQLFLEHDFAGEGDLPDEPCFTVEITCNMEQYVDMHGSGIYTEGTRCDVGYSYRQNVLRENAFPFDHWIGDFGDIPTARFVFTVLQDINSVAYFEDGLVPCYDEDRGIANPLRYMALAGCGWNGSNLKGATFGKYRTSANVLTGLPEPRQHDGIDLYAHPGTNVYSAYSGQVVKVDANAPDRYVQGPSGAYGNQIWVESTVSDPTTGKTVTVTLQYAHLQYGNPIAVNPMTGRPFAVGDMVYMGELIGFTGYTGNAYNVVNKHLHFGARVGGRWVDPKPYLNGTYDLNRLGNGILETTRCDGLERGLDEGDNLEDITPDLEEYTEYEE